MGASRGTSDWIVRAAALVVLLGGLKLAATLVVPLLLACFLAIASAPLMFWLIRKGFNRYLALCTALSVDVAFFGAMGILVASGLNALVGALPRYQARIEVVQDQFSAMLMQQGLPDIGETLPRALLYDDMSGMLADGITSLAQAVSSLALVLLVVAFLLVEMLGIENKLRHIFKHPELGIEQFRRAAAHVQRYMVVKSAANLLTGVLTGVWLAAFRVDFALLWGVCAFMLSYVPTLGSVILGVPVLIVTLLQWGFGTMLVVGTGYILINTAIAALVEPKVFGQALGLSPLVVFVSMVCWGWFFGPVGAVLSVPLTVVVKIALAYVEGYEWFSQMLGPVTGSSGVGTPSIPPGTLTAATSSGGMSRSPSMGGLTPVGVAVMQPSGTMTPIGQTAPTITSTVKSSPPPPANDD